MRTRLHSGTPNQSPTSSPQTERPSIRSTVTRMSYRRMSGIEPSIVRLAAGGSIGQCCGIPTEGGVLRRIGVAALAVTATAAALTAVSLAPAGTSAPAAKKCSFTLRIGDVLPFTGDLSAYGANLDRAVKIAVGLQNAALRKAGLAGRASVKLVGSEDGQTQASASVESATKLVKSDHANVIIGEMASSATIPMAQSVTIPNKVVVISPTSSAPQITDIADNGYLWRAYPSDTLQGKVLAQAAVDQFGKGAKLNVGAR